MRARRRGFALLVVLWVLVSASLLALAGTLVGREAFRSARNRVNDERARWRAEDCLARAQATIDALLANTAADVGSRIWRTLDTAVTNGALARSASCSIRLRAAGSRVDVNGPDEPIARALLTLAGTADAAALRDALLDALLDWRDADGEPRPLGAEAEWYAAQQRHVPRDGALADVRELQRVRGFERLAELDAVFGVDEARISIANAPRAVLLAVPGFTSETVDRILEWRARGRQITDVVTLAGFVSPASADSLMARYPDIARLTTLEPDAWLVTGIGVSGAPADTATIELRIVRGDGRAVVVRRRSGS